MGNPKEAEDEAEASTADTLKLSIKSHKGLPMDEGSSLAKNRILFRTHVVENKKF